MSDTNYVDFTSPAVNAAWLNDVNAAVYRFLGNSSGPGGVGNAPTARNDIISNMNLQVLFIGPADPATIPANGVLPYMCWADTTTMLLNRRSADGNSWVVESTLFQRSLPEYATPPAANVGPVYVPGQGPMEWEPISGAYVTIGGGAAGGGPDKIFYETGQNITQDYTLAGTKNAVTPGPITINDGVTVTIEDGATWVVV